MISYQLGFIPIVISYQLRFHVVIDVHLQRSCEHFLGKVQESRGLIIWNAMSMLSELKTVNMLVGEVKTAHTVKTRALSVVSRVANS